MTSWQPRPAPYSSHCAACGAHWRMHQVDGNTCPQRYRPQGLREAEAQLQQALVSGDPSAAFVARGEVQRLGGDPDSVVPPAYTSVTADDWVATDRPRQVRCASCGGALVTISKVRTCDTCGKEA